MRGDGGGGGSNGGDTGGGSGIDSGPNRESGSCYGGVIACEGRQ